MTADFSGKTIAVTGAGRGIGRAIACAFAQSGGQLLLLGRGSATLDETARAIRDFGGLASTFICDVSDRGSVEAAVDAMRRSTKRVDVLVNNAGASGEAAPFLTLSEATWDEIQGVNLKGPFLLSQAVARWMSEMGGGVILNNASIAGLGVDGEFSHYSAAKAGLLALTRSMAVELAPHGIRVNSVCPGYTRTDMTMQYFGPKLDAYLSDGFVRAPLRRIVEADEVAQAFLFLASDAASAITAANLIVDGGITANLFIMETFPPLPGA